MSVLKYPIYTKKLSLISPEDTRGIINTLNLHSYVVAKDDFEFQKALLASDVLLPDGIGVVHAVRLLKGEKIQKIAGYDVFIHLMKKLDQCNGSCFFLGASEHTLALIQERANKEFPSVTVTTFSPPFKAQFSEADTATMCAHVNAAQPDVLFVGMTAPKQEIWTFQNKHTIQAPLTCSIGAVFDFYAGTVCRPHKIWIDLGLEWLGRFLKDPKRLWRRTVISVPIFAKDLLVLKLKQYLQ